MKLIRIEILCLISVMLTLAVNSDEKKLKFRGLNDNKKLEALSINISPDLLNIDETIQLKSKYKIGKEFAIKTEQSLKEKKKN